MKLSDYRCSFLLLVFATLSVCKSDNVTSSCDLVCQNGGTCEWDDDNEPKCNCPLGTTGDLCESEIDFSVPGEIETAVPTASPVSCSLTCQNEGTCIQGGGATGEDICECATGFTGTLCDEAEVTSPASSTPFPVSPPTQIPTAPDQCFLQCLHGGECVLDDGEPICSCPTGLTGTLCEQLKQTPCGSKTCYNGSVCTTVEDGSYYCDCSVITSVTGVHYAGDVCQFEATTYCDEARDYFCVNGGECQSEGSGTYSCVCPDEWVGPSCEFESPFVEGDSKDCTLSCMNGGVCRKGTGSAFDEEDDDEDSQRCVCPQGFTGDSCEHAYEECGNGEYMCLHGTICVAPTDEADPSWTCACDDTSGEFCQHHQTTVCTTSGSSVGVYRGLQSMAFCVNDGVCTEYESDGEMYPACDCPEGYTGPHCELLVSQSSLTSKKLGHNLAPTYFALFILIVVIIAAGSTAYMIVKGQDSQDKADAIMHAHEEDDIEDTPMMDQIDFEDYEGNLEDVDLL
eukprot:Nitzschia sp. Nitz4//scaffold48_size128905//56389//58065//NITZ4_003597-RA/size128905-augustus-gene-0.22-mRNA-1//-1//CDS//3329552973//255//frame0